jgi:hypothetical protein
MEEPQQQFDYDNIPQDLMDKCSMKFFKDDLSIVELLSTPGVMEILMESYNNEILEECKSSIEDTNQHVLDKQLEMVEELILWLDEADAIIVQSGNGSEESADFAYESFEEGVTIETPSYIAVVAPGQYARGSGNTFRGLAVQITEDSKGPCCIVTTEISPTAHPKGPLVLTIRRAFRERTKAICKRDFSRVRRYDT